MGKKLSNKLKNYLRINLIPLVLLICLPCSVVFASINHHFSFYGSASGGYGSWSHFLSTDGQTSTLRFALGMQRPMSEFALWGAELSMQLGNRMRLITDSAVAIATLGSQPIFLTIRPPISLLLTATFYYPTNPLFMYVKGGASYLNGMIDIISIPNKMQVLPEAQIGFGISLANNMNLITYYQYLFGRAAVFSNFNEANGTASLKNLPTFQAGFIGLQLDF